MPCRRNGSTSMALRVKRHGPSDFSQDRFIGQRYIHIYKFTMKINEMNWQEHVMQIKDMRLRVKQTPRKL